MLLPVMLLLLVCRTEANYTGGVYSYTPKNFQAGSVSGVSRFKFSYTSCEELELWLCSGCSKKIEESRGEWCLREYSWTWGSGLVTSWRGWEPGNWIDNRNGISTGLALVFAEVKNRSDINRPNSSPQTSILPLVRVPSNCQRNIRLLAFDPDGDKVQCRYAADGADGTFDNECYTCTPPSVLSLSSSCTLSFSPTNSSAEGPYAVQLMMEDFPRENITLTDSNGLTSSRGTSSAISRIPAQFLFKVDPAAPSCTEGEYLPRFLPPTPEHGAQIFIDVNQTLEINIRAEATQSVITELLFSGPVTMVKNSSGSGYFTLRWTPSATEDEESHPICFVVQANFSSSVYQSDLRCIIVTTGNTTFTPTTSQPTTTTTTPSTPTIPSSTLDQGPYYVLALNAKISTTLSLEDDSATMITLIKDELKRQGLPSDIIIQLLSHDVVEVTTAAP